MEIGYLHHYIPQSYYRSLTALHPALHDSIDPPLMHRPMNQQQLAVFELPFWFAMIRFLLDYKRKKKTMLNKKDHHEKDVFFLPRTL